MTRIIGRAVLTLGIAFAVAGAWPSVVASALERDGNTPPRIRSYREQLGLPEISATANAVVLGGPFAYWNWPSPTYFSDMAQNITIESSTTPGAPVFWSYQFQFEHGDPNEDGAYIGLQDGSSENGAKIAIFSVWNADSAQGTTCTTFGGEGIGWTCRIAPYNWVPDRTYRVRVTAEGTDATGSWYRGSITDTVTRTTQTIGRIHVPRDLGLVNGWTSWTEYFGPPVFACADLPKARARFAYPVAQSGRTRIASHSTEVDPGDCKSQIEELTGAVRMKAPK